MGRSDAIDSFAGWRNPEAGANSDSSMNSRAWRRIAGIAAACALLVPSRSAEESGLVDLRPRFTAWNIGARKQGERNTCSVCVTTSAFEFALARGTGEPRRLSVDYLNWACNQVVHNKTVDRGQFFHHLLAAEEKYGICTEASMPYLPKFDPDYAPGEEARQNAKAIKTNDFRIHWIRKWDGKSGLDDAQFEAVKNVLRGGWPVAAGASHSLLLIGLREDAGQPGGGLFIVLDSNPGAFRQRSFENVKTNTGDAFWIELNGTER